MLERLLPGLAVLLGCSEPLPLLDDLGDPCRSAHDVCIDDDTVRSCESGVWVQRDCASVCAERGPAYEPAGCDRECVCELLDPSGCTPNETTCVDESRVAVCDATQVFQPHACSDVCADAGLAELGCREGDDGEASCWCTSEGTPCITSVPACVDDTTIATCEAGVWTFHACDAVCGGPAICDPFRQPAACTC